MEGTPIPILTLPAFAFEVIDTEDGGKIVVIAVPGLVQLQLPLGTDAARALASKLSGGIVIPENFDLGDITGLTSE